MSIVRCEYPTQVGRGKMAQSIVSAPKSEGSNVNPKEKDNVCSYLSPKTRERAVKEVATGAGVLGELSATSALVSVSFETNGEIRTSHRMGSCRQEDQTNSTSRAKSPLLVTTASHSLKRVAPLLYRHHHGSRFVPSLD